MTARESRGGPPRRRPDRLTRPSGHAAAEQLSAYTYGNVLVLAALVVVLPEAVGTGEATLVVAGTAVSTFIAHVFSDALGQQLVIDRDHADRAEHQVVRGSIPILSAASVPLVLMLMGWAGWLEGGAALRLAESFCIVRIAATGFFISRHRGRPISGSTWLACLGLAALGVGVVAAKIYLTH